MTFPKLPVFTLLSGIGWCLDFAMFNYLVNAGFPYFWSNLASATAGVSFVLITARRWIFRDHVEKMNVVVFKYIVWNIFAISLASILIAFIAHGLEYVDCSIIIANIAHWTDHVPEKSMILSNFAKLMITPITMYANFVAVGWIIERRLSFY